MPCVGIQEKKSDPIVDVDRLIRQYVKSNEDRLNFCERLTKKYRLEVQWSYVNKTSTLCSFSIAQNNKDSKIDSRKMCLFKTEFTNKTGATQTYTFKTERQTKSTARITVQKGFTLGGSLNCQFGLPSLPATNIDPLNITGGLSGTLKVTKTNQETFEENLLWSVDSSVEVSKNSKATASLFVEEEKVTASFEILHQLFPKEIHIPVHLVHQGTGRVVRSYEFPSRNLYEILNEKIPSCKPLENNGVSLLTTGICDVCYGAKQIISINETPYVASQESIMRDDMLSGESMPSAVLTQPISFSAPRVEAAV